MKPSEVRMWNGVLPFVGSAFGHAETEFAAGLLVLACRFHGDQWQPLITRQLGEMMKKELEPEGQLHHLKNNPFARPDLRGLVRDGFAEFLGDPDCSDPPTPIQFTAKGMAELERFNLHGPVKR